MRKCTEFTRISAAALINCFLQKCGAYLGAELKTIAIPLSTVFTRISAATLIHSPALPPPQLRRLFEGGAYSSNYCNWQLKSLLHLGRANCYYIYDFITFRTKCYYFGGARSKGFATLRNVSKLQFFDKIGQAKSVGFRLYSAI